MPWSPETRHGFYAIVKTNKHLRILLASLILLGSFLAISVDLCAENTPARLTESCLYYPLPEAPGLSSPHARRSLLKRLPELSESTEDMPPLVLFSHFQDSERWTEETLLAWLKRGVVPTPDLDEQAIDKLRLLERLGSPLILSGRKSFIYPESNWPYSLDTQDERWKHHIPTEATVPESWRNMPCPLANEGWEAAHQHVSTLAKAIAEEGYKLDGIWLDFENEPAVARYRAVLACKRCRTHIPPYALTNEDTFKQFRRTLWIERLGRYIADPVQMAFPEATITNWSYVLSTPEATPIHWTGMKRPHSLVPAMSATNPIAYGVNSALKWLTPPNNSTGAQPIRQASFWLIMQQVMADAANRRIFHPQMKAIPFASRWVPEDRKNHLPCLQRDDYRECLRQLWLCGLAGMQVFEPTYPNYGYMSILEIEDQLAVYKEMLPAATLIRNGTPLAEALPEASSLHALWTGLRMGNTALIRTFSVDGEAHQISLNPFDHYPQASHSVTLSAQARGRYFLCIAQESGLKIYSHTSLKLLKKLHALMPN